MVLIVVLGATSLFGMSREQRFERKVCSWFADLAGFAMLLLKLFLCSGLEWLGGSLKDILHGVFLFTFFHCWQHLL